MLNSHRERKETTGMKQVMTHSSFVSVIQGLNLQIYRLSNCKDSEQSNFNSAKGLNASQHAVSHKNIKKELKLFPETMKTKPCCI